MIGKRKRCLAPARIARLAKLLRATLLALLVPTVASCTLATHQVGPTRPITIDDDVAWMTQLAVPESDIRAVYHNYSPAQQAALRNQVISARMYIADMEYNYYEARLTREIQDEGLLATAISLGLTGSASLIPVAQTSRLLAGIATGVTGLDKAYNEKELLNNTVQALQTQMRRDRKAQAADIYSKMFVGGGQTVTPIEQYPLPMALSDVDHYYQAGTLASALIGLSKTVATAEQNADNAKGQAGPNPGRVIETKRIADPGGATTIPPVTRAQYQPDDSTTLLGKFLDPNGTGHFDPKQLQKIDPYLTEMGLSRSDLPLVKNGGGAYATKRRTLVDKLKLDHLI